METIKRIIENLKWLFNHPPIGNIADNDPSRRCDYCGSGDAILLTYRPPHFTVCSRCLQKVYDAILLPPTKPATMPARTKKPKSE